MLRLHKVLDPTGTSQVRKRFFLEGQRKLRKLRNLVYESIVDKNVFDIPTVNVDPMTVSGTDTAQKINSFDTWIEGTEDELYEDRYEKTYIKEAVSVAIIFALGRMFKGRSMQQIQTMATAYMSTPKYRNSISEKTLVTQKIRRNIFSKFNTESSRILQQGFTQNISRLNIYKAIRDRMEKLKNRPDFTGDVSGHRVANRMKMMTETEVVRSQNETVLDIYEQMLGKDAEISALVEWDGVLDSDICSICESQVGKIFKIDEARGMHPVHPNCFDKETEVLTSEGWKYFKDLNGNEKIFSMNPKTQEVDWVGYGKFIKYKYKGELIHLKSRSFDLKATPNHRQIYATRSNFKDRKELIWKVSSLKDLLCSKGYEIPINRNIDKFATYDNLIGKGIKPHLDYYDDFVYDVELDKWGILFTRRNNKTAWSGNCRCSWIPTNISELI